MTELKSRTPPFKEWRSLANQGERVTHLYPNDSYYAHLSIYSFAAQFCQNGVVLDAGSGSGYGSNYLASKGCRFVYGIDKNKRAVAFSQRYFLKSNLRFQVMDLREISGFPADQFDLIFSSNTLEHVADVIPFLQEVWRLLKPSGYLLVAVPPITNNELRTANLANPYHLNIWTPRQWYSILNLYFERVDTYRHWLEKAGAILDLYNLPEQTVITEEDFIFVPVSLKDLYELPTISAIFIAAQKRAKDQLPARSHSVKFVDDSFTRPAWIAWPWSALVTIQQRGIRVLFERFLRYLRGIFVQVRDRGNDKGRVHKKNDPDGIVR
jgi:SAM-dependent methyltransferase